MAIKQSKCRILVDEYDFSGSSSGLSIECTTDEIVFSVLQSEVQNKLPNLSSVTINQMGYYTLAAADSLERELYDRLALEGVYVSALLDTDSVAPIAYVQDAIFNALLKIDSPAKNLIIMDAKWPGAVEMTKRGLVLFTGVISATGATTTVDMAAAGIIGGFSFLHVTATVGTPTSATIKVQSSTASNFASPVDHNTFTVNGVGAQRGTLGTAVGRYMRLNCTSLGGATSLTVVGIACVKGQTY